MNSKTRTPPDTQMMNIFHAALRRDLDRAAAAIGASPPPGPVQRVALAQHLQTLMSRLHGHHAGEDAWLWPTLRAADPSIGGLLDRMEADHLAIAGAMEQVVAAATEYETSPAGRDGVLHALSALRGVLDPHLRAEEDEILPIASATVTQQQWTGWEQEFYVGPKSKKDLGLEGMWLVDGATPAQYDHVVGKVNPLLRFVLPQVFGPVYRRECAARWGGDVNVRPGGR